MKSVFAAVAMIVLASCGKVESQSKVDALPKGMALGFEIDLRPADGNLTTVTVVQNSDKFATVQIVEVAGRSGRKSVSNLGDKFICNNTGKTSLKLTCSYDLRPVDGDLTQVTVVETSPDSFEAVLTKKFVSRQTGKDIVEKHLIAGGMHRKFIGR